MVWSILSHLCVNCASLNLLNWPFIYTSMWKNPPLQLSQFAETRHLCGIVPKHVKDPQAPSHGDAPSNNTVSLDDEKDEQKSLKASVIYSPWILFILVQGVWTRACWFFSAGCAAHFVLTLQYFWKVHLITPETVISQKQGDSKEETIQNLSVLADTGALKYHFSKKLLEKLLINCLSVQIEKKRWNLSLDMVSVYHMLLAVCQGIWSAFGNANRDISCREQIKSQQNYFSNNGKKEICDLLNKNRFVDYKPGSFAFISFFYYGFLVFMVNMLVCQSIISICCATSAASISLQFRSFEARFSVKVMNN